MENSKKEFNASLKNSKEEFNNSLSSNIITLTNNFLTGFTWNGERISGLTDNLKISSEGLKVLDSKIATLNTNLTSLSTSINATNEDLSNLKSNYELNISALSGITSGLSSVYLVVNKVDTLSGITSGLNNTYKEFQNAFTGFSANFTTAINEYKLSAQTAISKYINQLQVGVYTDTNGAERIKIYSPAGCTESFDATYGITYANDVCIGEFDEWTPNATDTYNSSKSTGFDYRTSTGCEIVVDDETIRLKSPNAQILVNEEGIQITGNVFINGVKL